MREFKLGELAEAAGVTPRTVRYYIAQGLLPSPGRLGPSTRYGADHLFRLRLIKQLQEDHLPLAEIRQQLEGLSARPVDRQASSPRASTKLAMALGSAHPGVTERPRDVAGSTQWERFALAPGIEVHVRRPSSPHRERQIESLIEFGRGMIDHEEQGHG